MEWESYLYDPLGKKLSQLLPPIDSRPREPGRRCKWFVREGGGGWGKTREGIRVRNLFANEE